MESTLTTIAVKCQRFKCSVRHISSRIRTICVRKPVRYESQNVTEKNITRNEVASAHQDMKRSPHYCCFSWWRHQMETFSALLAICAGNSPVPGEFPAQRPVTRCFDVSFDLHPHKRLSKQWWGRWYETLSCPLWRHGNVCTGNT